ncbi:EAL domain-containing protein [Salmonella enterica]|uniref:Anti-FlhC(2)FlhD(4) factor YdiV n=1 Tax=Salmonella enterica TaxID=28901 RepID=A0A5Z3B3Q0_SALER|nr:EAL domain-containing protein [Salmonella enterica]ECK3539549.1 EAL domain-containing protein [Salmonella enterica]ECL6067978.1 EAL domain-containing protein [Salmonella enterica]ECL6624706.1 EAL domain-containing protein [Salmonella enterica]ECO7491574.1 EAL domain-containing protein [Salmonella enterica]
MSHTHQVLRNTLMEHRVIPYFQPIINASTGTYTGAEILVRIHHINGEIVLPASFITSYTTYNELIQVTRFL